MFRIFTIFFAVFLFLAGCGEDPLKPDDLIEEPLYIDVLTELFLHEKMVDMREINHKADSLKDVLFEHYELTEARFERSHEYYQRSTDKQLARIDTIQSIMQSERDSLEQFRQKLREAELEEREREREEREQGEAEEKQESLEEQEPQEPSVPEESPEQQEQENSATLSRDI